MTTSDSLLPTLAFGDLAFTILTFLARFMTVSLFACLLLVLHNTLFLQMLSGFVRLVGAN
jgi:hypothetical protein